MNKIVRILLPALAAALLLTGCFGADPAVAKAGKELMERYLSAHYAKAKLDSCDQWVSRPAADQLVGTSWVRGSFTADDGTQYDYWADTGDGSIYTDERISELNAVTARVLAEAIGMVPGGVVAHVYPVLILEDTSIHGFLPVAVGDLRQYVTAALRDTDIMLRISAGGSETISDAQAEELSADWNGVQLKWYQLETLPTQAEADSYGFWRALAVEPTLIETKDYHE